MYTHTTLSLHALNNMTLLTCTPEQSHWINCSHYSSLKPLQQVNYRILITVICHVLLAVTLTFKNECFVHDAKMNNLLLYSNALKVDFVDFTSVLILVNGEY